MTIPSSQPILAGAGFDAEPATPRAASTTNRRAGSNLGGYDGGQINHLNYNWHPLNRSADMELAADNPLLRARARDLARNDSLGVAAKGAWTRMLVGSGIPIFADVRGADGEPMDDLNEAIDDWYDDYMEEADHDPDLHHYDQQRLLFGEVVESGDGLALEVADNRPDRLSPIAFQILEIDYLDQSKWRDRQLDVNEIKQGIEYDVYGRPAAYYLFDRHPLDLMAHPQISRRIPADRVIHCFWKARPTQTRGVSWFHPVIKHLANMGGYLGSELASARAASRFAAKINRAEGAGSGLGGDDGEFNGDPNDSSYVGLDWPIIADLKKDDDIEIIESARPGSPNAAAWLKFMLTLMANGMGLSYQALTREATGSFSGNKATKLSDQEALEPVYDWFVRAYVCNVRVRVLRAAMLEGKFAKWVQPFEFKRNPRRFLKHTWPEARLAWLDPNKEVEAELEAIDGGIGDYASVWGKRGKHWRKAFRQLQSQRAYAAKIGLALPPVTGVTASAAVAPPVSGPESDVETDVDSDGRANTSTLDLLGAAA